jgi:8-amino-7-oxononanoate synthase
MPEHSLLAIKAAYHLLAKTNEIEKLRNNIQYFIRKTNSDSLFIKSTSSLHCKVIAGNKHVQDLEERLSQSNLFVKSIKSPTVKERQERIRICLHSFNTYEEIDLLISLLSG